jgi:hypothetical protein
MNNLNVSRKRYPNGTRASHPSEIDTVTVTLSRALHRMSPPSPPLSWLFQESTVKLSGVLARFLRGSAAYGQSYSTVTACHRVTPLEFRDFLNYAVRNGGRLTVYRIIRLVDRGCKYHGVDER